MKLTKYSKYLGILLALSIVSCNITPSNSPSNNNSNNSSVIKNRNTITVDLKGTKDEKPTGATFSVKIKGSGFSIKNDILVGTNPQPTQPILPTSNPKTNPQEEENSNTGKNTPTLNISPPPKSFHIFLTNKLEEPFAEGANPTENNLKWQLEPAEEIEVTFKNVPVGGPFFAMVAPDEKPIQSNEEKTITEEDKLRDWTSSLNSVSVDSSLNLSFSDGKNELIVQQEPTNNFTEPTENQFINNAILEDSNDKDENGKYISLEKFPVGEEFTPKNIIVRVNDDDENKSNELDLLETSVKDENDLVPIRPVNNDETLVINKIEKGENNIKLWVDSTKTTQYKLGEKAQKIYIEGIKTSESIKDVQLSYSIIGKEENSGNVAFITVVGIESVNYDSSPNISSDPNFMGTSLSNPGKRAFAENLKTLGVTVKVKPVIEGIPVKMVIVDVDDPSANKNETDPEDVTEDNRDNSNAGEETWISTKNKVNNLRTSSDGIVRSTFQIPVQPGDNLRIAATLDSSHNPVSKHHDENAFVYHNGSSKFLLDEKSSQSFQAKSSDLLTIWRKLNIYTISMNAPTKFGNNDEKTGIVQAVTPLNKIQFTITVNEKLEPNLYDMGLLRINGNDYLVDSNTENTVTFVANPATGQVPPVKDVKYELWDDDVFSVNPPSKTFPEIGAGRKLLPKNGFSTVEKDKIIEFYKPAYILTEFPNPLDPVPFMKNLESENGFSAFKDSDQLNYLQEIYDTKFKSLASSKLNWNVFIIFGFQGDDGADGDGNDDGTSKANTYRENQITLLFMETIREISSSNQGILAQIAAHEVGHNFKHYGSKEETSTLPCTKNPPPTPHSLTSGGHTQFGLMQAGSCPTPFSAFSLDLLRKTQIPGK